MVVVVVVGKERTSLGVAGEEEEDEPPAVDLAGAIDAADA